MYSINYLPNNCVLFVLRNDAVNHNTYLIYFDTAFLRISDWFEIVAYVSNCINTSILSLISPPYTSLFISSKIIRNFFNQCWNISYLHNKTHRATSLYKLEKRLRLIRNIFDPTSLFSFTLISLLIFKLDNSMQLLNILLFTKYLGKTIFLQDNNPEANQ